MKQEPPGSGAKRRPGIPAVHSREDVKLVHLAGPGQPAVGGLGVHSSAAMGRDVTRCRAPGRLDPVFCPFFGLVVRWRADGLLLAGEGVCAAGLGWGRLLFAQAPGGAVLGEQVEEGFGREGFGAEDPGAGPGA